MKWDATEPSQGTFTYAKADAIVSWAQANEQEIRGHTLGKPTLHFLSVLSNLESVWYNQLPAWVTSGSFANATLVSIMENHVTNLVTHFKGSVKTWDVTNEIFQDDGTWRASVFYTTIGEYFVDIAYAQPRPLRSCPI
jgi:endo-1,4-beta-xylanase